MILLLLFLLIIIVVIVWGVAIYNKIIVLRNTIKQAWGDIDVQLKRRYDLIPNLVETVKGYAKHERGTFEKVTEARRMAISARTPREQARAENMLTGALKSLFAVAEAYPELKANQNFLSLQSSLNEIEDAIQNARRYYNAVVRDYNVSIQKFPNNIVAGAFGFGEEEVFELELAEERKVPEVEF